MADTDLSPAPKSEPNPAAAKWWLVPVLSGLFALLGTAVSLGVNSVVQRSLEVDKFDWQKGLEDDKFKRQKDLEDQKVVREEKQLTFASSVELANRIAAAEYEIGSFLESVTYHPKDIEALFAHHEAKMKELMPPVVAAHVAVSARDRSLFDRFLPLLYDLRAYERCVTEAYNTQQGGQRLQSMKFIGAQVADSLSRLAGRVNDIASVGKAVEPSVCALPVY